MSYKDLEIKVYTNRITTKGPIFEEYLPNNSSIGVWVTDLDGESYGPMMNETFSRYSANGEGANQLWTSHNPIPIDKREAVVYAAYPITGSNSDTINVYSDQTDQMYAKPVNVSRTNHTASLVMQHALSIIEFSCVKNSSFSGAGVITAFKISGNACSTKGKMVVKTGKLTELDNGATVEVPVSGLTLSDTPSIGHIIVIPQGVRGDLRLSVKVDNTWYSADATPISLSQGKKYHYDLSIGKEYVKIGQASITKWVNNHISDEKIEYGNYKIKITGDKENLAFSHSVSDGIVTLKAVSLMFGASPRQISCSGATVEQSVVEGVLTANISNINSDIEIQFNGSTPYIGLADGVYAVDDMWNPVRPGEEHESNIGVMLVNKTNNQRFFIEKHEADNPIYAEVTQGYLSNRYFYWGVIDVDQPLIENKTSIEDAAADFRGMEWSNVLVNLTSSGSSSETSYATIGSILKRFIDTKYLGKEDWYIPAYGQLSLIYANEEAINMVLSKIGGYLFDGYGYWSSTEYGATQAWAFSYDVKKYWYRVRLILDL